MNKTLSALAAITLAALVSSCSTAAPVTPAVTPPVTVTQTVKSLAPTEEYRTPPPPEEYTPAPEPVDSTTPMSEQIELLQTAWDAAMTDVNELCPGWVRFPVGGAMRTELLGKMVVASYSKVSPETVESFLDQKCSSFN